MDGSGTGNWELGTGNCKMGWWWESAESFARVCFAVEPSEKGEMEIDGQAALLGLLGVCLV